MSRGYDDGKEGNSIAIIFEKTVGPPVPERNLILAVREVFMQPFEASDWTDLRVGWFLSVTDETADDTITGLSDTITAPPIGLPSTDYVIIGLVDRATFRTFCGFTNIGANRAGAQTYSGDSMLVSSDVGVGTTNTNFWRPKNSTNSNYSVAILDDAQVRQHSAGGSEIHFPQNTAGAGGYATLLSLRFQRPDAGPNGAREITMSVKRSDPGGHSGDVLFNNDPSKSILEANLEGFPTTVQTLGPFTLSHVPDMFWVYWPFSHSRLRIHAMGILKAR